VWRGIKTTFFLPEIVISEGRVTGSVGHDCNRGALIGKLNIWNKIFETEEQIFVHPPRFWALMNTLRERS
jgi:hypothetical protein